MGHTSSDTLKSLLWFCRLMYDSTAMENNIPSHFLLPPSPLPSQDIQSPSSTERLWHDSLAGCIWHNKDLNPSCCGPVQAQFPFYHHSQGQSPSPCEDHSTIEGSVKMTMERVEGCASCLLCGSKTPCEDPIRDLEKLTLQRAPHHREDPDCYFYLAAKALLQNQGDISCQFWNQDKVPS